MRPATVDPDTRPCNGPKRFPPRELGSRQIAEGLGMRRLVVVVVVAVSLLAASSAMAGSLSVHRALQGSLQDAATACSQVLHCRSYGIVRCGRVSSRAVDCQPFLEYSGRPRRTCTYWLDWRLKGGVLHWRAENNSFHCRRGWRD